MTEEPTPEMELWSEILGTYRKIVAAKPGDRSEQDRRYAMLISKYQDIISWYNTMIMEAFEG